MRRIVGCLILVVAGSLAVGCQSARRGARGCPCPSPCAPGPGFAVGRPAARSSPTPAPAGPLDLARAHGQGREAIWSFLASRYDADRDGRVSAAEYPRAAEVFARMDGDHDGALTAADFRGPTVMDRSIVSLVLRRLLAAQAAPEAAVPETSSRPALPDLEGWRALALRLDGDHDGRLTPEEVVAAHEEARRAPVPGAPDLPAGTHPVAALRAVVDQDGSGDLSAAELAAWGAADEAERQAESAKRDPEQARRLAGVAEGEPAPDFTLERVDGGAPVTLSSFRGRQPVALIFGSYTCPPFRHAARDLRALAERHAGKAAFFFVYIHEAHAVDGPAPMPAPDQPLVEEPATLAERRAVARACVDALEFRRLPTLVDGLDDAVAKAYAARPIRLYLIAADGTVAYRGGRGPFAFDPAALGRALNALPVATPADSPSPRTP